MSDAPLVWEYNKAQMWWELWNRRGNIAVTLPLPAAYRAENVDPAVRKEPTFQIWEGKKDSVLAWIDDLEDISEAESKAFNKNISRNIGLPAHVIPILRIQTGG